MSAERSASTESPFWNVKMECASREDLARVQLVKLQAIVRHVWNRSPFYRRHFEKGGFHPDQLASFDDLRR